MSETNVANDVAVDVAVAHAIGALTDDQATALAGGSVEAPDPVILPRNVGALAKLCAADDDCYRFSATTGVRVERTVKGYEAVATDGKVLGIVTGPAPVAYPPLPALAGAPHWEAAGVVGAKDFALAFKAIPKQAKRTYLSALDAVALILAPDRATLASTNGKDYPGATVAETLTGRFPPHWSVVPDGRPAVKVKVDPRHFARLLLAAAEFTDDVSLSVTIDVYDHKTPMKVSARNASGQEFTGAISLNY